MQLKFQIISLILIFLYNNCIHCEDDKADTTEKCLNKDDCYDRKLHPQELGARISCPLKGSIMENKSRYWLKNAIKYADEQIKRTLNENIAKNMILFVGDGMSFATIAATRVYIYGEEKLLSFEKFPYTGLIRTSCIDKITPDSGCTATALLTGIKTNYGTVGVNGHVKRIDCKEIFTKSLHTKSIAEWVIKDGKSVGLVTTSRITHATPAALYAHVPDRNWENDAAIRDCADAKDIAYQLVHGDIGKELKVMLGGGKREFCKFHKGNPEGKCLRKENDLIKEWLSGNETENRVFVEDRDKFLNVDPMETDRLLGLFHDSHLLYHLEAEKPDKSNEQPTLEEMTEKAIEILRKNDKGYFLLVESGNIDTAHHTALPKYAFDETMELSKAVQTAYEMTDESDTLIIVTADHSHTMTMSGYPHRHQDILTTAGNSVVDKLPYLTINYHSNVGFKDHFDTEKNKRRDPEKVREKNETVPHPSMIPKNKSPHAAGDIPLYASGPFAHIFTGSYDQYFIPHLMAYASCIGNFTMNCADNF